MIMMMAKNLSSLLAEGEGIQAEKTGPQVTKGPRVALVDTLPPHLLKRLLISKTTCIAITDMGALAEKVDKQFVILHTVLQMERRV